MVMADEDKLSFTGSNVRLAIFLKQNAFTPSGQTSCSKTPCDCPEKVAFCLLINDDELTTDQLLFISSVCCLCQLKYIVATSPVMVIYLSIF